VDLELVKTVAWCALPVVVLLAGSVSVVRQGHVGVTLLFGKF
jgi:hypothetical protein